MTTALGTRHLPIAALLHYALTRIAALTPRNYGVPPEQHTVILGDDISMQSVRSTLKPAYELILRCDGAISGVPSLSPSPS
jgi:hypothetical protein